MEEGKFLAWLKRPGERVKEGELLFTLESDKAVQEVEAIDSGILCLAPDAPNEGDIVQVGRVLGWLLADGETAPTAPGTERRDETPPATLAGEPPPRAATPSHAPHRSEARASPRARRAAKQHQVDVTTLSPTGKGGRIRERDVLSAANTQGSVSPIISATGTKEVPLSPTRRTIAARLMHGRQTTVPVTITCRCDATQLVTLSRKHKAEGEAGRTATVPTINDILIKLTGTALERHPMLTGVWADGRILIPKTIHIGIAVDADDGLRVPVVRDVCSSTLAQIAAQTQKLIAGARAGQIAAVDMQDGCFTISNLGSFGVDSFTPVINPPESAILGIGAIAREAVPLDDGSLAARERMTLSLTFDHRVIDGAPAARFLQTLRQLIEQRSLGLV